MRIVLAFIGVVVVLASFASLGVLAIGLSSTRVVTDTQALPSNMRALAIDTGDDQVVVKVVTDADAQEPRVDVRMVTRGDDSPVAVAAEASSTRITLSDSGSGFLWFSRTGEITVILPPDVARGLSVTVNERVHPINT
jgi:hypothetical protein